MSRSAARPLRHLRRLPPADMMLAGYAAACLVLGGASAAGAFANGLLQLAAVAILAWAALTPDASGTPGRSLRWLLAGLAAVAAVQFLPLPPALWGALPGRAGVLDQYRLLGAPAPWLPVTLAPDRALGSLLALLPFLATLVLSLRAGTEGRVAFVWVLVAVASLSILVGAVQLAGGSASPLYFYAITNRADAVGFFANSNHLATLFLVTLPFLTALAVRNEQAGGRRARGRRPLFVGCFLFLLFGLVLNGSSAGLALLAPCLGACWLILRRGIGRPVPGRWVAGGAVLLAAALVFISVGPFRDRFLDKAISGGNSSTRGTSIALTIRAARDFMPVGSGVGSFLHTYTAYEDVATVNNDYVNHAHCDWAEVALETGVMGLALLAGLVVWLLARGRALWAGDARTGSLARGGLAAVALVMLHSLVDYPARTAAILCVLGAAAGMVAVPRPSARAVRPEPEDEAPAPRARGFVAD